VAHSGSSVRGGEAPDVRAFGVFDLSDVNHRPPCASQTQTPGHRTSDPAGTVDLIPVSSISVVAGALPHPPISQSSHPAASAGGKVQLIDSHLGPCSRDANRENHREGTEGLTQRRLVPGDGDMEGVVARPDRSRRRDPPVVETSAHSSRDSTTPAGAPSAPSAYADLDARPPRRGAAARRSPHLVKPSPRVHLDD